MKATFVISFFTSLFWLDTYGQEESSLPPYRLPDNLVPETYNLDVFVSLDTKDFRFWGTVDVKVKCAKPTTTITLNSKDLQITDDRVKVNSEDNAPLTITERRYDTENELYIITTEQELAQDATYTIHLAFEAPLVNLKLAGFYRSNYYDFTTQVRRFVAVTQAEPTSARGIFPCFDELQFRSSFTISITHSDQFVGISNMPLEQTVTYSGREYWVTDEFRTSVQMSTYLVALAVTDFQWEEVQEPTFNIPIRMWSRRDVFSQTAFSQEVILKSMEYYSNYFLAPYEIGKLDLLTVPDFAMGGMENYGLLTFSEYDQLYSETQSPFSYKVNTARVVVHEAAHLFVGDLVSFRDWNSDWAKEGIASFLDKFVVSKLYPDFDSFNIQSTTSFLDALAADGLKESRKLAFDITSINDPQHLFDSITYDKGAHLIRMLYFMMGEESFQKALSTFVNNFKYKSVGLDELWQTFTDVARTAEKLPPDADIKAIMDTWTGQRGYPYLKVERNTSNKKITVTQENFVFNMENDEPAPQLCWWFPITFTTSTALDFANAEPSTWINCNGPVTFDAEVGENDWIILNLQLLGLCRVQYDDATWGLISKTLLDEKSFENIDPMSRAQLLADLHGLSWVKKMEYKVAFETLAYLKHENNYIPWLSGMSMLDSLNFMLSTTEIITQYTIYAMQLMEPLYTQFGNINEFSTDDPVNTQFKAWFVSWACSFGAGDCQDQANQLFKTWMAEADPDGNNPIHPSIRSTAYCWGVVFGGAQAFDFLFQRYANAIVVSERSMIIDALACVGDLEYLQMYLNRSIDPNYIRQQDSARVFSSISWNGLAADLTINFLIERFDDIYRFHHGDPVQIGEYLNTAYNLVMTEEVFNRIQDWAGKVADRLAPASIRLNEAVGIARDNIMWHQRSFQPIKEILSS